MPLLKRRTATTTDDRHPLCRYCHVAVNVDANGCCELGHRVMTPEEAAILHARADVEAREAAEATPAPADGQAVDPGMGEDDEDLESLIAEAAHAEAEPGVHGAGAGFEGEYRQSDEAARDLADELDSLWGPPSSGAPTEALAEPGDRAPTEAFSALQSSMPTEPLGSPADSALTTRLDGGDHANDDLGPDGLTEEERAAVHAPAGNRRGESALDEVLDFGDEQA